MFIHLLKRSVSGMSCVAVMAGLGIACSSRIAVVGTDTRIHRRRRWRWRGRVHRPGPVPRRPDVQRRKRRPWGLHPGERLVQYERRLPHQYRRSLRLRLRRWQQPLRRRLRGRSLRRTRLPRWGRERRQRLLQHDRRLPHQYRSSLRLRLRRWQQPLRRRLRGGPLRRTGLPQWGSGQRRGPDRVQRPRPLSSRAHLHRRKRRARRLRAQQRRRLTMRSARTRRPRRWRSARAYRRTPLCPDIRSTDFQSK